MADTVVDDIKVILSADDKAAKGPIDDLIARLENLDKAANGTGNASRDLFKKMASGAESSDKVLAKAVTQADKHAHTLAKIKTEEARTAAYAAKADATRAKSLADTASKMGKYETDRYRESSKAALDYAKADAEARRKSMVAGAEAARKGAESRAKVRLTDAKAATEEARTEKAKADAVLARVRAEDALAKAANKRAAEEGKLNAVAPQSPSVLDRIADAAERAGSALSSKLSEGAKKAGLALAKLAVAPLTGPIKALTGTISKFGTAVSNLFRQIKRVVMYRAIRSAIRMVTDGFKEGTQNAYQWSKAMGGQFAASMDMLATSSLYLKNSLGALVTPLINAVAPAIDFIIDKFVALINVINQVIAMLTGAPKWTKAIKYPKEYADAANQAAGGAGKLAKALTTILAIDELNPLNGDNGGGGGGGGGSGSALDYSSMFDEVDVATKSLEGLFEPFVQAWQEKGQGVIDALRNALDGVDQVIRAIGTSFAEVWQNGTGQATVEHILGILTGILNTIGNIGTAFAEAWNEDNVGTQIIQNIWDMVNEILEMWDDIANETAEWAKSLDFGPILQAFESLTGAIKPLVSLITDSLSWAWTNVLLPLGKWTIEDAAPVLIDTLATALETLGLVAEKAAPYLKPVWDNFLSKLASLTGGAWLSTLESLRDVLKDINDALSGDVSVGDWVEALIKDGFKSLQKLYYIGVGVKALFGEYNYAKAVKYLGMAIGINDEGVAGAAAGVSDIMSSTAPSMGELQVDVKGNLVSLVSDKLTEKQKQVPTTADINKRTIDPTVKDSLTKTSMTATLVGQKYGPGIKDKLTKTDMTPTLASPLYAKGVKSTLTKTSMVPTLSTPSYAKGVEAKLTKTSIAATIASAAYKTTALENSVTKPSATMTITSRAWGSENVRLAVQQPQSALNVVGVKGVPGYVDTKANFTDYDTDFSKVKMPIQITAAYRPDGVRIDLWKAEGGAFYGGKWHDIAQYATGGVPNHGSLFMAGEAGAEIVGHVGGRTEVLNQSQIASTIAAATQMSNASQNSILVQLLNVAQQIYEGQGDVRAYIPAGEVVSGLQRNNRRDGRALVPMGV